MTIFYLYVEDKHTINNKKIMIFFSNKDHRCKDNDKTYNNYRNKVVLIYIDYDCMDNDDK